MYQVYENHSYRNNVQFEWTIKMNSEFIFNFISEGNTCLSVQGACVEIAVINGIKLRFIDRADCFQKRKPICETLTNELY